LMRLILPQNGVFGNYDGLSSRLATLY